MKQMRPFPILAAGALAVASASAQTPAHFQWLNENPGYVTNTVLTNAGAGARTLCVGDVDGDDDADALCGLTLVENGMVLGAAPTYGVLTADAGCAVNPFMSLWADSELADFDGDGAPEIVAVGQQIGPGSSLVGIWRSIRSHGACNTTVRFLDAHNPTAGGWSYGFGAPGSGGGVEVADFDNDGDLDFVTGYANGAGGFGVMFYRNLPVAGSSARSFLSTTPSLLGIAPSELAAGDFDGDGLVDLAIGGGTFGAGQYMIARGVGGGRFAPSTTAFPAPAGFPLCLTAADVDGDADTDLVVGTQTRSPQTIPASWFDGGVHVLANNGTGTFTLAQPALSTNVSFTDVAVGDVDEDGLVDLVGATWREWYSVWVTGTGWVNQYATCGTRVFGRPAPGASFTDQSLARIGTNPALSCFDPADPLVDARVPFSCLDGSANAVQLVDVDLDLDLDILVAYQWGDMGVFTNMLWQLETPRTVTATPNATPGFWDWNVPFDHYCEFNVPNFGVQPAIAVVGLSLTPPTHAFPATALGVLTNGPYVLTQASPLFVGQGQQTVVLGPFDTPTMTSLIGVRIWSTSFVHSFARNLDRLTTVVDTTLQ